MFFHENRRVFWIETGAPGLDRATAAEIAKERAGLLEEAKKGKDGVVDGDAVRFLRAAAKLAAVAAGEIPPDEICEEEPDGTEREPVRVLPFSR